MSAPDAKAPRVSLPIDEHVVYVRESVYDRLVAVAAERGATLDEFTRAILLRDRRYTDAVAWGDPREHYRRARLIIGEAIQPRIHYQGENASH